MVDRGDLDPDELRVELEHHEMQARRTRRELMQAVAATMSPEQRRAWIRKINTTAKVILIGSCGWLVDQVRDHALRTAVVGASAIAGAGSTMVVAAVIEAPPEVMPYAVEVTAEPELLVTPGATRTVTASPEPAATVTVTLPPDQVKSQSVTEVPGRPDVATLPRPEQSESVLHVEEEPDLVVEVEGTPDRPPSPEFTVPTATATSEPTVEPTETPEATATPTPTLTRDPTLEPEPDPTRPQIRCQAIPDHVGVAGTVCDPGARLDPDGRWLGCLRLDVPAIWQCLRHPAEWFSLP